MKFFTKIITKVTFIINYSKKCKNTYKLLKHETKNLKFVCVFAPIFNAENEKDGYFKRIKEIDNNVFGGIVRFYISVEYNNSLFPFCKKIDNNHFTIIIDKRWKTNIVILRHLIKKSGKVYIHSVYPIMEFSKNEKKYLFSIENVCYLWDVHGAVPEENDLLENYSVSSKAADSEKFLFKNSSYIICVCKAMQTHLIKKYGAADAEFIILPIFSTTNYNRRLNNNKKTVVIYAGGMQKWQDIDLMVEIINKTCREVEYRIFLPDVTAFDSVFTSNNIYISSKSYEELLTEYTQSDFGFCLRDDITVNNVACPTKLIEYLNFGIIPILKSDRIGDFKELGMQYINYLEFSNGEYPNFQQRLKIIEKNNIVLEEMKKTTYIGMHNLKRLLEDTNENYDCIWHSP